MITWTKLTDKKTGADRWVLRGPVAEVKAGSSVRVTKRDGTMQDVIVAAVSKTFPDKATGAPIVFGYPEETKRAAHRGGRRTGCSCGSRENEHGELIPSSRNCASCEHDA